MKKFSAILLIAVLACGMAFAAFTGSAEVRAGYNLDTTDYGFIKQSTSVKISFDILTAVGEAKGEGDIYAAIKASLKLTFGENKETAPGLVPSTLKASVKIESAKIFGENWYVSILGMPKGPDYAKSAIDKTGSTAWSYAVPYAQQPGLEIGFADFVVGFGLLGNASADTVGAAAFVESPKFEFVDGITLQAAAVYSYSTSATPNVNSLGASLKADAAFDDFTIAVATDLGFDLVANELNVDATLKAVYQPITFNLYYARKLTTPAFENVLSAQIIADLDKAFEIPVKLTVTGKQLIDVQDLSARVDVYLLEKALSVYATGGFVISTKKWSAGVGAEYKADMYTAKAAFGISEAPLTTDLVFKASASVETTKLIPGATLTLAWVDGNDLTKKTAATSQLGTIYLGCKIAF